MRRLGRQLLLALCLACQVVPAQTNPPPAAPAPRAADRYLLLFDTSSAMKRRAKAVEQAAQELITSGMNGQLQRGDTLGIWTFDERLHAGLFPLQVWGPESREEIAAQVVGFLKSRKYQKAARFDAAVPSLAQLIASSKTITVLLFSDGTTPLRGTPFDASINSVYAEYGRAMQKSPAPFITVLRAKNGRIFAATASTPPWPVEFPPYPPEPRVTNAIAAGPAASPAEATSPEKKAAPAPAAKTAAPIILDMSGASQAEASPAPETGAVTVQPQVANQVPTATAGPHAAETVEGAPAATPGTPRAAIAATQPTGPTEPKGEGQPPAPPPGMLDTLVAQPSATPLPQPQPPATNLASKPESPPKPVQIGVTLPHEAVPSGRGALLAACLAVTAAAILLIVLLLRRRPDRGASLITRSMERDKE